MTLAHQNQNAVAQRPDQAPAAPQWASGVTDLVAWAHQYDAAYRFAGGICNTAFVSQQYRQKPEEAAAAILAGAELGFSPMTALRGLFDNIQGVTAPRAITQRAVVQSRGHEIWTVHEECNDQQAVVRGRRKGSDVVQQSTWTMERARGLNLTNKDNWKKQPGAMLIARATSECARLVASDALLGVPYSSEELRDDPNLTETHPDERAALPSPREASRGATRTSAADLIGAPAVEAAPEQPPAQRKASLADVKAAFDAAGVNSREGVTRVVSQLLNRDVTDLRTLTAADCEEVLGQATDLGADGLAALATGGQQQAGAQDDYDPAQDHASLFADESGEQ